ncbi:MAG TPA: cytochrome C oxidase assembly protein [Vitreimonas sp.]|nr:cytochrome C oxidase assembly protein [Vitreimonas sp.]HYD87280.1 cytochrome C oxidase assembly protein [Vitreimonas sp.]
MSAIMTPEELQARKRRNLWIALAIGAFVALVFLITLTKLQEGLHL